MNLKALYPVPNVYIETILDYPTLKKSLTTYIEDIFFNTGLSQLKELKAEQTFPVPMAPIMMYSLKQISFDEVYSYIFLCYLVKTFKSNIIPIDYKEASKQFLINEFVLRKSLKTLSKHPEKLLILHKADKNDTYLIPDLDPKMIKFLEFNLGSSRNTSN